MSLFRRAFRALTKFGLYRYSAAEFGLCAPVCLDRCCSTKFGAFSVFSAPSATGYIVRPKWYSQQRNITLELNHSNKVSQSRVDGLRKFDLLVPGVSVQRVGSRYGLSCKPYLYV